MAKWGANWVAVSRAASWVVAVVVGAERLVAAVGEALTEARAELAVAARVMAKRAAEKEAATEVGQMAVVWRAAVMVTAATAAAQMEVEMVAVEKVRADLELAVEGASALAAEAERVREI